MFIAIGVLIIVVSVLLGGIILIQKPKGGGLTAQFGGVSNQVFGASRTADFVEKATWSLAAALMVLCLTSTVFLDKTPKAATSEEAAKVAPVKSEKSALEQEMEKSGSKSPALPKPMGN